jgi:hypothetical protein
VATSGCARVAPAPERLGDNGAMSMHPLDAALALQAEGEGLWTGHTHPAWGNMVGPFGGITAAQLLQAICIDPRRLGEALSLTVNFAGPVADGPFEIRTTLSRSNRSTQHWQMVQLQDGAVCTTGSAVFAVRRPTWTAPELPMPEVPAAEQVPVDTRAPPIAWPQRYEMRFVAGGWPDYRGAQPTDESRTLVWLRDQPARPLDAPALAALADVFYPRVFRRRQAFTPAGTVSLTTFFHADAAACAAQSDRPVLGVAQGRRFVQGFFDQTAELWGDDGHLLVSSHQIVYFKG